MARTGRVIRIEALGSAYELYALGLETKRSHHCLLEPLQVQEPLAQCLPQQRLDGDAELFALGIEAYRIRLGYTFDPFFAVWSSRVDPLPRQLEAVYGVLLKRSRVRFLLANDPGAEKTIMAGLFLKELNYRGVAQRILIVTPANLTDQWRRELAEKSSPWSIATPVVPTIKKMSGRNTPILLPVLTLLSRKPIAQNFSRANGMW